MKILIFISVLLLGVFCAFASMPSADSRGSPASLGSALNDQKSFASAATATGDIATPRINELALLTLAPVADQSANGRLVAVNNPYYNYSANLTWFSEARNNARRNIASPT
jgi:hypothetical protein